MIRLSADLLIQLSFNRNVLIVDNIYWTSRFQSSINIHSAFYLLHIFIEEVENTVLVFCLPPSFYVVIPGTPEH